MLGASHGFAANKRWGKCARSHCGATAAVSFFSFTSRTISIARTSRTRRWGCKGDLGLTDSVFGTASGIFFIGYFALQIPGALLVERWSARWLLSLTLITWGALTTLTGVVRDAAAAVWRAVFVRRGRGRIFPGRDCLSVALVHLPGSGEGGGAVYGRDSNWFYDRRSYCRGKHLPARTG